MRSHGKLRLQARAVRARLARSDVQRAAKRARKRLAANGRLLETTGPVLGSFGGLTIGEYGAQLRSLSVTWDQVTDVDVINTPQKHAKEGKQPQWTVTVRVHTAAGPLTSSRTGPTPNIADGFLATCRDAAANYSPVVRARALRDHAALTATEIAAHDDAIGQAAQRAGSLRTQRPVDGQFVDIDIEPLTARAEQLRHQGAIRRWTATTVIGVLVALGAVGLATKSQQVETAQSATTIQVTTTVQLATTTQAATSPSRSATPTEVLASSATTSSATTTTGPAAESPATTASSTTTSSTTTSPPRTTAPPAPPTTSTAVNTLCNDGTAMTGTTFSCPGNGGVARRLTNSPTDLVAFETAPWAQQTSAGNTACAANSYINVNGNCVPRPVTAPSPPAGATAQCKDGTWSSSQNRSGTCSSHGGVARWL